MVKCPADSKLCGQVLPYHKLLKHLVQSHGHLPCEYCGAVLLVTEVQSHLTKFCCLSKTSEKIDTPAVEIVEL